MAVLPIKLYPDPVLLRPTREVERIDDEVRDLVRDMAQTLHDAPGIGLAANQVGVDLRLCIVDLSGGEEPDQLQVFINPRLALSGTIEVGEEGCLSFPDVTLDVDRSVDAVVEALDLDGKPFTLETQGLLARVLQHECEHLDGQTFLRNVSPLKRELVKKRIRKRMKNGDWVATA